MKNKTMPRFIAKTEATAPIWPSPKMKMTGKEPKDMKGSKKIKTAKKIVKAKKK